MQFGEICRRSFASGREMLLSGFAIRLGFSAANLLNDISVAGKTSIMGSNNSESCAHDKERIRDRLSVNDTPSLSLSYRENDEARFTVWAIFTNNTMNRVIFQPDFDKRPPS